MLRNATFWTYIWFIRVHNSFSFLFICQSFFISNFIISLLRDTSMFFYHIEMYNINIFLLHMKIIELPTTCKTKLHKISKTMRNSQQDILSKVEPKEKFLTFVYLASTHHLSMVLRLSLHKASCRNYNPLKIQKNMHKNGGVSLPCKKNDYFSHRVDGFLSTSDKSNHII
jgi:hypothetical protein